MTQTVRVIKKTEPVPRAPLSPFQLGRAKVESRNAFKILNLYADEVNDEDFLSEFRQKLGELTAKVVV